MNNLARRLQQGRYAEWRRRAVRKVLRPLFRVSDASLSRAMAPSGATIHRILICRPNHRLGNLLLLAPLLTELERTFPDARIDIVLAGERGAELFRTFRQVDHVYSLSNRMVRHPVMLARTMLQIRRARYDLAIDPCESSQSSRLLVAIAAAGYVIGIPRGQGTTDLGTSTPMDDAPTHMAQWPVFLLRRALAQQSQPNGGDYPTLDLRLSADERRNAREQLERLLHVDHPMDAWPIIGVFAEATGAKRHGDIWWQRFLAVVETRCPEAVFVEIAPVNGRARLALPAFSSPSPREVGAVISNMTCFVSADCGVMHLASAAGVPTIGLFSASDPLKYAPYGNGSRALDTRDQSPEEMAERASALINAFHAASPVDRGAKAPAHAATTVIPGELPSISHAH